MRHPLIYAVALNLAAVAAVASGQRHGPPPSELAQRCGNQIAWQESFEAAIKRAKEMKRPIFWYLATVPRSPMDRKPVVDMYMRAGPFSAPDVVNAINRRFIPLKTPPTKDQAKAYKLAPIEFVEPGFLVLKPDATEIGRVDKITTFHDLWFVQMLNRMLAGADELGRPSDQTEKATPENKARELIYDGLWTEALRTTPIGSYDLGRAQARLGDAKAAHEAFAAAAGPRRGDGPPTSRSRSGPLPPREIELGLLALREENWTEAEALFAKKQDHDQAQYLRGVALCRLNRQPEAQAIWTKLADPKSESPWAAKAAAEEERYGPFSRGFEEYGYLPPEMMPGQTKDITGTQRALESKDADWLVRRSVRYLLERQNPDGGWDDSNYDFGGRDSLPDVYVAVTALSALALLEWKTIEPERIQAAVAKAAAYLSDESHVATSNLQERVWAHAYRALFLSKLAKSGGPLAEAAATKLRDVVKRLQDLQAENGQFGHEYPNPFATATALHALKIAEKAGVPTPAAMIESSVAAMRKSQGDNGAFAYDFSRKGSKDLAFSGGMMPTCELALLLCGASSEAKLAAAIKTSVDHHAALERSRKYDDHVPQNRNIGGFFFWYDVFGRGLAIDALGDAAKKRAFFEQERKLICGIAEIDGRFIDSHELGKPYGTAMALLALKLATTDSP